MIETLFYRKLDGNPSLDRTKDEVDNLESYLSDYLLKDGFSFVPENDGAKYCLNKGVLVRIAVHGNFSLVIVETEKNCRGLLKKLKEFYTEVRVKSLE